jgi:hypothetical protein
MMLLGAVADAGLGLAAAAFSLLTLVLVTGLPLAWKRRWSVPGRRP